MRHPDFRHTIGWVTVRSTFALVFHLMGKHTAAREQFDALGPHGDPFLFGYVGLPADQFLQARDEAYAKGRAR